MKCLLIFCWLVETNSKTAGYQKKLYFLYFLNYQFKYGNISWVRIIPVQNFVYIFSTVVSVTQHRCCSIVTYVSVIWFTEFPYRELLKSFIFLEKQIFIVTLRVQNHNFLLVFLNLPISECLSKCLNQKWL